MITEVTNIEELNQIFSEILFNKTDKVTKISKHSVLSGISYGVSKIGQKALKDIALVESHLFPEEAFGEHLDIIAERMGIAPRFSSSGSSTYIRLIAIPGTQYFANSNYFTSSTGITFQLDYDVTIDTLGYIYVKVRSQETGEKTNVDALTINKVSPIPTGHSYVINESLATGGRDEESDDSLKKRIKEGPNILARNTLNYLTQVFLKINSNILKVIYQGGTQNGKNILRVITQNGVDLNQTELDELMDKGSQYFSLVELSPYAENYTGVEIRNAEWFPVDISFRVKLKENYNSDDVRILMQLSISKYLDFRFWKPWNDIQWDQLLFACSQVEGVDYIADQYFYPNKDIKVTKNKLPRLRGFLMLDLNGNVISNISGTLNPIYYPAEADFSFQSTVLKSII